jgi:hypothetical protein
MQELNKKGVESVYLKWVISSEGFYCTEINEVRLYAGSGNGVYYQWVIEKNGEILSSSYLKPPNTTTLQEAKTQCYQEYLKITQKEKPQN